MRNAGARNYIKAWTERFRGLKWKKCFEDKCFDLNPLLVPQFLRH